MATHETQPAKTAEPAKAAKATKPADVAKAADPAKPAGKPARTPGECAVNDGTAHMGRAVNGVVCSAHAMRYNSDGTRRTPA